MDTVQIKLPPNPVQFLNDSITQFLANRQSKHNEYIIKKHSKNLKFIGDFSFPLQSTIWYRHLNIDGKDSNENIFYYKDSHAGKSEVEILEDLKNHSNKWIFPIGDARIEKDRCLLFLERSNVIKILIEQSIENENFGKLDKSNNKFMQFKDPINLKNDLSNYRTCLIRNVLKNLITFTDWNLVDEDEDEERDCVKLVIKSICEKDTKDTQATEVINVPCGIVCNGNDKKICKLTYDDYFSLRSKDMQLMAMHKYGIRLRDPVIFSDLIQKLGKAAVTIDMLEVKHSSPFSIINSGHGCTRGSAFILYNYARGETILRTFEEKSNSGYYPKLPLFQTIDTTLLKEPEEWELLFNFVFYFPELMKRSTFGIEDGKCAPHLIIQYLNSLASLYSVYYRRVRILTENRPHLLPILFARIYLLKCLNKIFILCFDIIEIDTINYM